MKLNDAIPPRPSSSERDQISQNIGAVQDFYARESGKMSRSQRMLEEVGLLLGSPAWFAGVLLLVGLWMLSNQALSLAGLVAFDPAPFVWLQGLIGLGALLTTTVVLTKQNRIDRLAEQRAQLDLKVTLLTEQKAAKLIELLEELRRDLPNVKNRHDPEATELKHSMNPDLVLAALDQGSDLKDATSTTRST
jgi:uncharacterized membrane protein